VNRQNALFAGAGDKPARFTHPVADLLEEQG
jgi:hypothetical protein